jgi:hypothetical protein
MFSQYKLHFSRRSFIMHNILFSFRKKSLDNTSSTPNSKSHEPLVSPPKDRDPRLKRVASVDSILPEDKNNEWAEIKRLLKEREIKNDPQFPLKRSSSLSFSQSSTSDSSFTDDSLSPSEIDSSGLLSPEFFLTPNNSPEKKPRC